MRPTIAVVAAASCAVSGCASTPDVVATHYLPRGDLNIRAVRTVGCATSPQGQKQLFVATSVLLQPSYSRDPSAQDTIALKTVSGSLANATTSLTFYDDGRLKGVNSTSTGVGQEVVQSLVKLASVVLGGGLGAFVAGEDVCALIAEQQPKEKLLTINYALDESFDPATYTDSYVRTAKLEPEASTPSYLYRIAAMLPAVCAAIGPKAHTTPAAAMRGSEQYEPVGAISDDPTMLSLRQPANVPIRVVEEKQGTDEELARFPDRNQAVAACGRKWVELFSGSAQIPQIGTRYQLAIPRGAPFGGSSFELAVAESGAVTNVKYGKTSGAPALLGALNSAVQEAQPDTAAQKAAEAKAEADLIAQQQRLIRCQMDPAKCT